MQRCGKTKTNFCYLGEGFLSNELKFIMCGQDLIFEARCLVNFSICSIIFDNNFIFILFYFFSISCGKR